MQRPPAFCGSVRRFPVRPSICLSTQARATRGPQSCAGPGPREPSARPSPGPASTHRPLRYGTSSSLFRESTPPTRNSFPSRGSIAIVHVTLPFGGRHSVRLAAGRQTQACLRHAGIGSPLPERIEVGQVAPPSTDGMGLRHSAQIPSGRATNTGRPVSGEPRDVPSCCNCIAYRVGTTFLTLRAIISPDCSCGKNDVWETTECHHLTGLSCARARRPISPPRSAHCTCAVPRCWCSTTTSHTRCAGRSGRAWSPAGYCPGWSST